MPHKLPRGLYALVDDSVRPELPVLEKARAVIAAGAIAVREDILVGYKIHHSCPQNL